MYFLTGDASLQRRFPELGEMPNSGANEPDLS
jgi:hypothetical protein